MGKFERRMFDEIYSEDRILYRPFYPSRWTINAQKNSRGRTCYCISLYSGKQTSFYRGDVLGVMDKRSLPKWAKMGLQNALEIRQNEKSHPNERGEAR